MMSKSESALNRFVENSNVQLKKINRHKYLIGFEGKEWFIWPEKNQYVELTNGKPIGDMFYSELKLFYHRYITKTVHLPKNSNKKWKEEELSLIYEMIENEASINQIANELERHPVTMVSKIEMLTNEDLSVLHSDEELWDVSILEFLAT